MSILAPLRSVILGSALLSSSAAEEVAITAEKAVVITFPSQTHRTYKLLAAPNPAGDWSMLKDGIVGTGGEVTIFYKSESDQKLFFKVETSDGPPAQRSLLSLANLDISHKDLTGYDLEGDDLRGYNFHESKFDNANLSAADLTDARFIGASFLGADLSQAVVEGVDFSLADFNGANLQGIRFIGCFAGWADFRNANLRDVRFDGTVLSEANFSGQTLTNFSFRFAGSKWKGDKQNGLRGVNFSGANLTGADLSRNDADGINLTGAIITGVNLEASSLNNAVLNARDLRSVFLRGIAVYGGDWSGANANGVNMSLATVGPLWNPTGASFDGANLEGLAAGSPDFQRGITNVNFRNANLRGADLEGMIFRNCDFTGADLSFANVIAADFTGCVGLDPEQPGMQFGGWSQSPPPAPPRPTATILPDGTPRVGTNPGEGLAPSTAPAKLQFVIEGGGVNQTVNLQLNGGSYSEDGTPTGTYIYEPRGRIAVFKFHNHVTARMESRTLIFTSPAGGDLFSSDAPTYQIGTFTLPD